MTMFYFDKWNKNGKKLASFLNNNAQKKDFEVLNSNIERLENIITEETKSLFNNKNSFIWFTFFNQFTKLGLDDSKFAEFLHNFVNGLRNTPVDGKFFDTVDELGSTKDKLIIKEKLHILETLMKGYLHIEDTDNEVINEEEFIAEILELDKETIHNDMDFYKESLKDLKDVAIKDGSKLLQEDNNLSLLAMVVYSYKEDIDLEEWLTEYAKNNNTYFKNQRKNYFCMLNDLEKYYMEKNEVA